MTGRLLPAAAIQRIPVSIARAGSTRPSNLFLGGADWYEADWHLAPQLRCRTSQFSPAVMINSTHAHLTVRMLVRELGIRSILNLGAGLPTLRGFPDTAAAAEGTAPRTPVVQVDWDSLVDAHLRMGSAGRHGQNTFFIADLSDIDVVLAHPAVQALQDHGPVGVLVHDVLPYFADDVADRVVRAVRGWLPPGSAISLTHATTDLCPADMGTAAEVLRSAGLPYRPRTRDAIHHLLDPWPLLPPGLVPTGRYHPDRSHAALPDHHSAAYAAVALHPHTSSNGALKGRSGRERT